MALADFFEDRFGRLMILMIDYVNVFFVTGFIHCFWHGWFTPMSYAFDQLITELNIMDYMVTYQFF